MRNPLSCFSVILPQELDTMEDPTKKEVAELRRKIETVDRELRPMKALCERKVSSAPSSASPVDCLAIALALFSDGQHAVGSI